MKPYVILIFVGFSILISILFSNTSVVKATYPDAGTSVPSPWPTIVFETGKGIDTTQQYTPKVNDICWTWNHIIGRIGDYYVPSGKQLLVIKFLSNQNQILVNNVACENDVNRTPMERAAWANAREPWYYTWDKIVTYYVGDNMQVVTLTVTPTESATPSVTETSTTTPTSTATETSTRTASVTASKTLTRSPTRTRTSTRSPTRTRTSTRSPTRTQSVTRTSTVSPTATFGPFVSVGKGVSTLYLPKDGDICYGEYLLGKYNKVVEFTRDLEVGISIRNGGCFKNGSTILGQIFRHLNQRGIYYDYMYFPPDLGRPSRTLTPTITVIPRLPRVYQVLGSGKTKVFAGTICWGDRVDKYRFSVVKFTTEVSTPINPIDIVNGGCYLGVKDISVEDAFNFLKRRTNYRLDTFLNYPN